MKKVLLSSFHLNRHTYEYHPPTQKLKLENWLYIVRMEKAQGKLH